MTPTFTDQDPDALAFYTEHGYVVLAPRFEGDELLALRDALRALWARFADEQGLPLDVYLANISQWRDLWRADPRFRALLGDPRLWSPAAGFMGRSGARFLHDHVIAKPAQASSMVPWHQDYPYWPVDTPGGLSCWCPLEDVGPNGGCLEVIDGSHRWGESPPADFLASDPCIAATHEDRVRLPAAAGSIVILDSLTWHRSGPNHETGSRAAYISLWLPPDARYAPDHSRWHPVNEHVTVEPGEVLNEDWFPCFGEREIQRSSPIPLAYQGPTPHDGLSMFNASAVIATQLQRILARAGYSDDSPGGLGRLLAREGALAAIVRETIESGVTAKGSESSLRSALDRLRIGADAYRLHRARNVYNGAYVEWWQLAGASWNARLGHTAGP